MLDSFLQRKRNIIDLLFQHGICISYDRVIEISTSLGDAVIRTYLDDVFWRSVLQKKVSSRLQLLIISIIIPHRELL